MTTLVWFRNDLRLADNPALDAAGSDPEGIVALYVLDEESEHTRPLGGAAKWWLHHSLSALTDALAQHGVPLILRRGRADIVVPETVRECEADHVVWNRRYGTERNTDSEIKTALVDSGIEASSYQGDVLFEPWTITTKEGSPYRVYSAFWRACTASLAPREPYPTPTQLAPAKKQPASESLDAWQLLPVKPDWSTGLAARWEPGEKSAQSILDRFLAERSSQYAATRDIPSEEYGSELSPNLRWGEISPRTVWHRSLASGEDVGMFLSEVGWREFAKHTAFHFGPLHLHGLNPKFDSFPWRAGGADSGATESGAAAEIRAWQQGATGFGLVDAGMRELWETGFMHNRVRMVTASFLTKNLLVDWRIGEAWFWDTLVDADDASNPFNWQWVAGCGADAAPYFRIFNPELQQKKFDPEGLYVDRWASDSVALPRLVDLKASRARALDAYDQCRSS